MIKTHPDPVLRQKCSPVEVGGLTATTCKEALLSAWKSMNPKPMGIAAPQVGLPYRVVLLNLEGRPSIVYNPEIVGRSPEREEEPEGCLSLPGVRVMITRYRGVVVKGTDSTGKEFTKIFVGEVARAFQHELDHLDGMLVIDRMSKKERKDVKPDPQTVVQAGETQIILTGNRPFDVKDRL